MKRARAGKARAKASKATRVAKPAVPAPAGGGGPAAGPAPWHAPSGPELWHGGYERLLGDPSFAPLVRRVGPVRIAATAHDTFSFLVRSITFQQLAGKAAATIHGRLVDALGGSVTPAAVLLATDEALRGAGLSRGKLTSIRDLAGKVQEGVIRLDDLEQLPDELVIERLTHVRGIGRWTAEMTLLFHLKRPDVWPVTDLGVRAGLARVLSLPEALPPEEMRLVGIGYRPWRSAVAWYCWRALEPGVLE